MLSGAAADLDDLRTLFLLSLHGYRRTTSKKTYDNVSLLVRLCYQYGLHQTDNLANCSFYRAGETTCEEIQGWRYLWWSIFLLDTCCTAIATTPSNIDRDSVCVALPHGSIEEWTSGKALPRPTGRLFLRGDLSTLA
ncbi:uncharacterized protein A1O9_08741 [Exophiala aquamarina CBS 119918]|uniref:Xylanolytic transcriptional activator regulatory domain-containing protein n=1 Tax=Exophiala aquamarina CBS 119918 TaxID=1182545 RepID=A0A072P727_9EURO|nr:uncharacterized protein A1O9_08741 [Exophiala aquamarina CBS 119918]KEF55088.1 hypothetical protein A1O9_08741 [Exophiala aquamarina CBS 119918]